MGQCFLYGSGGGNPLGYSVICQAAEPAKKEGRIWVKSSVPMTHFEFGDPWESAGVGTVLIRGYSGADDPAAGNCVIDAINGKVSGIRNRLKINPYSCQQVQGTAGNFVYVEAYICHSDTWVQFSFTKFFLFNEGDQRYNVTGGWAGNGANTTTIGNTLTFQTANTRPYITTAALIDLWPFTKLRATADQNVGKIGVTAKIPTGGSAPDMIASGNLTTDATLDISGIDYGYITLGNTASYATENAVSKVWLE